MAHDRYCRCYDCKIEQIERNLHELFHLVKHLYKILGKEQHGFQITQGDNMPITGIIVGASGVFQETPTPAGAVIPPGTIPQWSTSDTANTTLTPSADGTQVTVAVASTAPAGGSFNLTVTNQDGSFPTTVPVPFLPPAVPPQTGFEINQLS